MTASLRLLVPDDAPMLAGLHAESFGPESWSTDQLRGSLTLDSTKGWLALAADQPAGFLLCQVTPEQVEVITFCVRPAARRQGIGEHLLWQAQKTLPLGASLLLEVAADNAPARRLYERCGFTQDGYRKAYYRRGGQTMDAVTYRYGVPV